MMNLDIRILAYLKKLIDQYLDKRYEVLNLKKLKLWTDKFIDQKSIIYSIDIGLNINLYEDSVLSKLIFDGFEENEIRFLRRFLRANDTFVDIGSNIGLFSLHAAQVVGENGKVFAFEPTPLTYNRLNENIRLNDFEKIIYSYNIGLSDKKGKLFLNISTDGHDAWNTFAKQDDKIFSDKVAIPVDSLDGFLESQLNHFTENIDLIKIDVEGWEQYVLSGARSLLSKENAPVLMVEFTETNLFAAGTSCSEIYDLVLSFGYKWYRYDAQTNLLADDPKRLHYPYDNLFAIKNLDIVVNRLKNVD
jgi:FkbM family methyltransferase